ncbi:MAG: hypothetical protein V1743_02335 [Nanoarchaeota archaeon]
MRHIPQEEQEVVQDEVILGKPEDFFIDDPGDELDTENEDDFYSATEVEDELDDDRLSGREAAFMRGYIDDLD